MHLSLFCNNSSQGLCRGCGNPMDCCSSLTFNWCNMHFSVDNRFLYCKLKKDVCTLTYTSSKVPIEFKLIARFVGIWRHCMSYGCILCLRSRYTIFQLAIICNLTHGWLCGWGNLSLWSWAASWRSRSTSFSWVTWSSSAARNLLRVRTRQKRSALSAWTSRRSFSCHRPHSVRNRDIWMMRSNDKPYFF